MQDKVDCDNKDKALTHGNTYEYVSVQRMTSL